MSNPKLRSCRTYSGTAPYAFFSYAHADADRVLPVIDALDADRIRLWYDAGIQAGANWPEVVATRLLHAQAVLFFLSAAFLRSQNCIREVHYAAAERKPMICVYLEPVTLPNDLKLQFSTAQVIRGEADAPGRIAHEAGSLLGPSFIGDGVTGYETIWTDRRQRNGWRAASLAFAGLFLATALFAVGYLKNWFPDLGAKTVVAETAVDDSAAGPAEITEFKDGVSQSLLLRAYEGSSLYLCGDYMVSDPALIRYADGAWFVGDGKVSPGRPEVLAQVAEKPSVVYLALVNENIGSFDALAAMPQLIYLDISGNPVRDLSFLKRLPGLRTVKLVGVAAADYSVLSTLPALEAVYVDRDALDPVLDALAGTDVDVIVKR